MDTTTIQALTVDQVVLAYSGKPGCACGCRGKHYRPEDGAHAIKEIGRILRIIKTAEDAEGIQRDPNASHGVTFSVWPDNDVLAYEHDARLYFVHLKKGK